MSNKKTNAERMIYNFLQTFAYVFTIYSIIYDLSPKFHLGFEYSTKWDIYTTSLVMTLFIVIFIIYPAVRNKENNNLSQQPSSRPGEDNE